MKTKNIFYTTAIALLLGFIMYGQDATVTSTQPEYAQHLDLEAVATLFAKTENLEDFEHELNHEENKISNLDLNQDNQVDYLRVEEFEDNGTHVVSIQAVLGEDSFQDIATIEVDQSDDNNPQVQIVGATYIYGPNYIIEPRYRVRPRIFNVWWRPGYKVYRSRYYWGFYPRVFRPWRPLRVNVYRTSIRRNVNTRITFKRVTVRRSTRAVAIHKTHQRTTVVKNKTIAKRNQVKRKTTQTKRKANQRKNNRKKNNSKRRKK